MNDRQHRKICFQTNEKGAHAHSSLLYADNQSFLTYVGVAEGVLRVRQSARAALRQLVNVQAAEDEQQADQVLVL